MNQTDFVCLRDKIPDDSSLRQVFKPWRNDDESGYVEVKKSGPGIPLPAEFQIHCSKEEGEQLLAFAKKALSQRGSSCRWGIGCANNMMWARS